MPVNKLEVRICGIRRSGHHAILNWIMQQAPGEHKIFINNVGLDNPLNYIGQGENKELNKGKVVQADRDLLIYNYERHGFRLKNIFRKEFLDNQDNWTGNSDRTINVLVLRDLHNNFASLFKCCKDGVTSDVKELYEIWFEHAEEFIGKTNIIPEEKIFINYNTWTQDKEYRKDIIENKFSFEFTDAGFNEVSRYGNGSSFDYMNYKDKASEMDVLNRWENVKNETELRNLINSRPEVIEINNKIFHK